MKNSQPRYFVCSLATQAVRKMVAHYNQILEPMGLTTRQAMALGVLWQEDGPSLGTFAKQAGMGKAAAVTMIRRLERMGLVTKKADPEDARLNVIELTPKAEKLAPELLSMGTALEKQIEAELGQKDMEALIRGLSAIRDLDL